MALIELEFSVMPSFLARGLTGGAVLSALVLTFMGPAVAGPGRPSAQYSSSDVLQAFQPPASLGATRAICIGTASECGGANVPAAPAAASFDMLISFEYNSDDLTAMATANLDEFAKALQDQRFLGKRFLIEGHTDAEGSKEYNLSLSDRRAAAVAAYLTKKGVDGSKLVARGYGKSQPRAANPFDATNRRVEARLSE